MSGAELKQLQTRKAKVDAEIKRLSGEKAECEKQLTAARGKLAAIQQQIDACTADVVVSEHAMLRYMERVMGVDLNKIKVHILAEGREELIRSAGSGAFPIMDDIKAVVKGRTVVTIR